MTTLRKMMISFTAGMVIGILYAPAKGRKTRRKISRMGEKVKSSWNDITDSIETKIESIRENVNEQAVDQPIIN